MKKGRLCLDNIDAGNEVVETYEYGGFWSRFVAFLIDSLIIGIPIGIITIIIVVLMVSGSPLMVELMNDPTMLDYERELTDEEAMMFFGLFLGISLFCSLGALIISWLYYAVFHSSKWQGTLGYKLLGLKVIDLNGQRISFWRATGRFFAKSFLSGILLIGYIIAAFTDKKQALHDMIARTIVIKNN